MKRFLQVLFAVLIVFTAFQIVTSKTEKKKDMLIIKVAKNGPGI